MKILHVNVSRTVGGGLVNHVDNLMTKQIEHGHSVSCFSSGSYDLLFLPYLRRRKIKKITGVDLYELKNSPNRPLKQRGRSLSEIKNEKIENAFNKVFSKVKPDVVHIHDLQGLCSSIIDIAMEQHCPLVYTFHNYWPLCPEVELFDYTGNNCLDYENGFKCVRCNYSPPSYYHKLFISSLLGPLASPLRYKRPMGLSKPSAPAPVPHDIEHKASQYVLRRKSFIERLNRCDALIAISGRVKEIYSSYGVKETKIKIVNNPLFLEDRTIDELKRLRERRPDCQGRKLYFCYRGGIIRNKGVHVLIDAFKNIDPAKAELFLYGRQERDYADDLVSKSPANIHFAGTYETRDLPKILKDIDVGIIPSVWEECFGSVGLEYLAAGIPIVGSRIGGTTDYLKDNVNGLFFEAGDHNDLAKKIDKLILDRDLLKKLKQSTDTSYKTLDELLNEMDEVYRSIL